MQHPMLSGPKSDIFRWCSALLMFVSLVLTGSVWAQATFLDRPIRVVVPFGVGSSPDVTSRLWGESLSRAVGHNIEALPPTGFHISCFPQKIRAASAGWTRAVAIFFDQST